MKSFLDQVVIEKKEELNLKKSKTPLDALEPDLKNNGVRNFKKAIMTPGSVIAEVKKKSPTTKTFLQQSSPEHIAQCYEKNGASAISIVTDRKNFGTSLKDVKKIKENAALPILVKEFVIDPYQVYEARAHGADALLLIARILTRDQLAALMELTNELNMSALVECHEQEDFVKASESGAEIIGINNRDLKTLTVSLSTSINLAPLAPKNTVLVSESGINSRMDMESLLNAGLNAFLIGSALLNSKNPGKKLRALLGK